MTVTEENNAWQVMMKICWTLVFQNHLKKNQATSYLKRGGHGRRVHLHGSLKEKVLEKKVVVKENWSLVWMVDRLGSAVPQNHAFCVFSRGIIKVVITGFFYYACLNCNKAVTGTLHIPQTHRYHARGL